MKKTLLFLCSILIIGVTACTKTEYVQPDFPNRTVHANISKNQWTSNSDQTKWEVELSVPDIDALIMDHGTVLVDIAFDQTSDGEWIYEPLSDVYEDRKSTRLNSSH